MKIYKYIGDNTQRFTIAGVDYCLVKGETVSLPSSDSHVKRLIAKGKLKELKQTKSK